MKQGWVLSAVSALALSLAGGLSSASAESLKDAIAMTYAQNPTLMRQRALQRANDETYVQARSNLGPTVSLGGSVGYTDTRAPVFDRSSTALSVTANQNLFASGGLSASVDAAKADVYAGQQNLHSVESDVLFSTISIYTAVRRDQEALAISEENRNVLKRQLDETQAMFDAGQLTRTDVAQSQARLAASEASLASVKSQLDSDRAAYRAIVGQSPVALEAEPELPNLPATFEEALKLSEAKNFDLLAALKSQDAAEARLHAARSVYGPTVSLSATGSQIAPTNRLGDLDANKSASASLRFSIPLFASGANQSSVRQASESLSAARQSVEIARRGVIQSLSQAWSQMLAARAATTSNEEQVRAAQIAAEGVKTEHQVGLRTNIEVLNAEQELRSAQLSLIEARRNQYLAASQVLSVSGGLTAQAFVPDIEVYDAGDNFKTVAKSGWTPIVPVVKAVDGAASKLINGGR
jgi:outer membrane protein